MDMMRPVNMNVFEMYELTHEQNINILSAVCLHVARAIQHSNQLLLKSSLWNKIERSLQANQGIDFAIVV